MFDDAVLISECFHRVLQDKTGQKCRRNCNQLRIKRIVELPDESLFMRFTEEFRL